MVPSKISYRRRFVHNLVRQTGLRHMQLLFICGMYWCITTNLYKERKYTMPKHPCFWPVNGWVYSVDRRKFKATFNTFFEDSVKDSKYFFYLQCTFMHSNHVQLSRTSLLFWIQNFWITQKIGLEFIKFKLIDKKIFMSKLEQTHTLLQRQNIYNIYHFVKNCREAP